MRGLPNSHSYETNCPTNCDVAEEERRRSIASLATPPRPPAKPSSSDLVTRQTSQQKAGWDPTPDYDSEMKVTTESFDKKNTYELPDGNIITVGNERFHCPEVLFQLSFIGE